MALGLSKKISHSIQSHGITLRSLFNDTEGFPINYLPKMRIVDGDLYIRTYASGHDADMSPVFFKWLIIDPKDLSASPDSLNEYARVPESGFLMRIMQRSLLPYHENFVIDYYENINALNIVGIDPESKEVFQNKFEGVCRTFRIGDYAVPEELKTEIYTYPDVFFNTYLRDAIPPELFYNGKMHESNQMSSYTSRGTNIDMGIMSHGLNANRGNVNVNVPRGTNAPRQDRVYNPISRGGKPLVGNQRSGTPRPSAPRSTMNTQQIINQQVRSQYNAFGAPAGGNKLGSTGKQPTSKSFYDSGLRYMQ